MIIMVIVIIIFEGIKDCLDLQLALKSSVCVVALCYLFGKYIHLRELPPPFFLNRRLLNELASTRIALRQ